MSYEKAMRHVANKRKRKKQATMHFGFDSNTTKQTPHHREAIVHLMFIKTWFPARHDGDAAYNRACLREAIASYRELFP